MALPDLPGVPKTLDRGVRQLLEGLREHVREIRGFGGDAKARAVTIADVTVGSSTTIVLPSGGGGGGSYTPDLTPPPTPSGVSVGAGLDFVGYKTNPPTFTQGNGYARTRVYGVKWPTSAPVGPTFSAAVLVDEFVGQVGSMPTEPATRWCIWLKWVTRDGVESVDPATDGSSPNGFVVTTGQDPSALLQVLSGQITESQLFAALGARIDLVDGSGAGSVNARIATSYSQVLAAVAAAPGNLLANNSFEQDSDGNGIADGWAVLNPSDPAEFTAAAMQSGRLGGFAQRVTWAGVNTTAKGLTQSNVSNPAWGVHGSWVPGATYVVSFYARADTSKASGCSMYWPTQAPASTAALLNPNLSTAWQRYAFRIVWGGSVEPNGRCRFGCVNGAAITGWLEFDDVQVEAGDTLNAYSAGTTDIYAAVQAEATTRSTQTGQLFAQYTVKLDVGGYVSGFGLASSSTSSAFAIRADRFYVAPPAGVSGVSDIIPFAVQATPYMSPAGELLPAGVYIDAAYIRNLDANLGRFQNAFITNAMIVSLSATRITSGVMAVGNYIQSSDYIPGVQGWRIHSGGIIEVDAAWIRGTLNASQINGRGLTIRRQSDNAVIIDAGAAVPIDSTMVNPSTGWLNSNLASGQNLIANSDQTSALTMAFAAQSSATIDAPLQYASNLWATIYTLQGGLTRNLTLHQDGVAAGGDGAAAADVYPLGAWDIAHSVACVEGQRFCFSYYANAHRCNVGAGLQFFDAGGAFISDAIGASIGTNEGGCERLTQYVRPFAIATAPSGAAYVRPYARKYNTRAGGASESWFWIAAPQLEPIGATAAGPSDYQPGVPSSTRQLGYIGDLNATLGAQLGSNLTDTGGSVLGDVAVKNSAISVSNIGNAYTINNIGSAGSINLPGLGYTGDLNATNGATIGTNLAGSFTQATWDVVMTSAYIRSAHVGVLTSNNLSVVALKDTINGGPTTSGRIDISSKRIDAVDDFGQLRGRFGLL